MSDWSLRQKLRESVIDAVNRGDHVRVKTLLQQGADVDESEGGYLSKQTLLMMAIEKGHIDVGNVLVEGGADLSAVVTVNKKEMTALDIAKEKELNILVKVIEKKLEANQRLLLSVQEGNSDCVQGALKRDANINMLHQDDDDAASPPMNLLFLALSQGHIDVAGELIRGGIDLHFTVSLPDQIIEDTARSFAQRMNQENIVHLIDAEMQRIRTTKDVNVTDLNSQEREKAFKISQDSKSKSSGEIEDIEDEDLEENPQGNTEEKRQVKKAAGSVCTIC